MHVLTLSFALVAVVVLVYQAFVKATRSDKVLEEEQKDFPGPYQLPWIGRIHDLPIQYMWLKFKEWSDIYGPIYKTKMLGATFLIISDEDIAEELLVKRAKIYSDRPVIRSLFDSKSTDGSMEYLPLMGRNKYWSRQRRFTHAYLTEASNNQYYGVMNFEVKRFLYRILTDQDEFCFHLEDMASKIMCQLTWDDSSFSAAYKDNAWGLLTQMSPAGPITNVLTPLWHLPMWANPWKQAEKKRHDEQQAGWMGNLLNVRDQMQRGEARHSWTRTYLENQKGSNLSGDYEASSVIGMMALVGIFTVGGPLHYFIMAMVLHQDWLVKCQAEIDCVCEGRMPTLEDSPRLPILRACIAETFRWRPNVPTGVAHEVETDDFYRGVFIEKGTRILPLDWAFLRNPNKYPDPDNFRPERYLDASWPTFRLPLTTYPTIKGRSSFGYGQRQCLGQTLTQDELLIATGGLCWAFNMRHKTDPRTGKQIPIDSHKSNSLLIVKPDKFQMHFEPRSAARRGEICDLWLMAEESDLREREAFLARARAARLGCEGVRL